MKRKAVLDNNNDTSRILGFKLGQNVKFNRHYFANHGMKIINLGTGVVQGKILSDHSVPKILVQFPFHIEFYQTPMKDMLATSKVSSDKRISTLLEIYPGYLEKCK